MSDNEQTPINQDDTPKSLKQQQVEIVAEDVETHQEVNLDEFISFETNEEKTKEVKKSEGYHRKEQNSYVDSNYTKDIEKLDLRKEHISLPTTNIKEVERILEDAPSIDLGSSEQGRKWVQTLNRGMKNLRVADTGLEALEDPNACFKNYVEHDSGRLEGVIQRGKITGGSVVSGEKALLGLRSSTGLGVVVRKPLWHSGIWLSIKTPSEMELIEVHRSLTNAKVELGRHTWGLALSATTGLISEEYFNLIIQNFFSTSAKDKEDLLDLILLPDLPIIQWQLACAVYPNGFQFSRACTCDPTKCNHVSTELINPLKLMAVNKNALTQEQKNHMSLRSPGSMDKDSITRYKNQHIKGQKRELKYTINDNEIKITLRIPTLKDYFNATHDWIDRLNERVVETLGVDASTKDRNSYINKLSVSTTLRQYAHYVESIDYGDIIEDRETIYSALDALSNDPDIVDKFPEDVLKYINDTMICIIGIPDYVCPICKGSQIKEEDKTNELKTNYIPIDPLTTFFTLHSQKLSRLRVVD